MGGRRYPGYGRQPEEYAGEYDEFGQDGEYEADHDDSHDGEPAPKRRSTTKVVFAVLGLAVFGSAAAFGYRTIIKAAPSGPTPIIRADNSPTKVMPAATDASPRPASGPFGERSGEQLVRRDEDPVDVGASYRSRAVDAADTTSSSPSEMVPATVGPASPGDPRRVRTVTIKADQGAASSDRTAASRAAQPAQPQSAPPPVRQAAATPAPKASGAPLAVVPDAEGSRVPDSGGFVVQLSAQRSEADAQTAFRTLQTKYSVLSGREPLIRRKDLGERGIFFAAQVGPFGAKSDADQLCETVKSAGGACFVQRN